MNLYLRKVASRGDKSPCRTLHFCSCLSRSLLFPLSHLSCLPPLKFVHTLTLNHKKYSLFNWGILLGTDRCESELKSFPFVICSKVENGAVGGVEKALVAWGQTSLEEVKTRPTKSMHLGGSFEFRKVQKKMALSIIECRIAIAPCSKAVKFRHT